MAKLDLQPIIDVTINLSLKSTARKGFNRGLIIGSSAVIPAAERVRLYTSADNMLSDGFTTDSEEYKAALLYFNASSSPSYLYVGVKDTGEDLLTAARACRAANSAWYPFMACGATDTDIKQLSAWAESAEPSTMYMYTTQDASVLDSTGADKDIFIALKALKYRQIYGQYSGSNANAVAATMGYAMGANKGTADSAFTLAYKTLVGIATDDLTEAQVAYITGNNGNVYVTRAEDYDILQQGYMADETSFDEVLNLDMLKNELTLNGMDLLYTSLKIPQKKAGVEAFTTVFNAACDKFVSIGFITPGKWNGANCLELTTGKTLPTGYLVQHDSLDDQSQADRDARKAPPFYVCCKLAGAIEKVIVEVNVNR